MAGLAGFGSFAGGFASGVGQGMRLYQAAEEERRRKAEEERQLGLRREAANTFGNIGQQREDGSVYSEDDAYNDYAKFAAKYDPRASMEARTAGLKHRQAAREERYASAQERWLDFQRRMVGADDDTYFREAAKFATQAVPDGKTFGIEFDANNGYAAVMVDGEGRAVRRPLQSREELEQMLASYVSPAMYKDTQDRGIRRRQVAAAERQAGAAEQNARRLAEFYAPGGVYERTHGASTRAASAAASARPFQMAGQLADGTPVVFNQNTGRYQNGLTGRPLTNEQLKLFQKVTGERPGVPEALGSTGYIRVGNDIFAPDPKDPNKLVRVRLPGQSIADRLRAAGQGGPAARPGAPMMPPAQGLPKPKYSPAEVARQRVFGFLTPDDLLMQAVEAGVPGAIAELERRERRRRIREQNQREAFLLTP